MKPVRDKPAARLRVGQAAEMLGVSVETLRRWETEGRLRMERSDGGPAPGRRSTRSPACWTSAGGRRPTDRSSPSPPATGSPGIVTRIERDRVAAVVEVIAGPHRLVSLMTAEAVDELDLKVGDEAVCVVKATNVIVEIPLVEGVARVRSRLARVRRRPGLRRRGLLERRRRQSPSGRAAAPPATAVERGRNAQRRRPPVELTIYGAASLKGALDAGEGRLRSRRTRASTLTISTDASSALETQIEQGAPADVFLSADTTNPQKLVDEGLADGPAGRPSPATS